MQYDIQRILISKTYLLTPGMIKEMFNSKTLPGVIQDISRIIYKYSENYIII